MKNWIKSLKKFTTKVITNSIIIYQKTLSPDHGFFTLTFANFRCRFYPSCSGYALDSIRQYGLRKGAVLSLTRILKCNPFHRGGYDPVKQ